jgi:hypothetical protein
MKKLIVETEYSGSCCNPSYAGGIDRRVTVENWPWEKAQDSI